MARKQKKYHYIYKTTCNVTGKYYIGMHSTDNLNDGYLGSGKRLWNSLKKHGKENHSIEILEHYDNREDLKNREAELVNEDCIKDTMCLNLSLGGEGGFHNDEHRKLFLSDGVKNGRKKADEIIKEKFGGDNWLSLFNTYVAKKAWENEIYRKDKLKNIDWTGKQHSNETKKLMSEQRKGHGVGNTNSQFGTCWITKDGVNKKIKKEYFDTYQNDGWIKGRNY